ncbi:L-lactate dehydrogenase (cytochrome) [Fusarium mexicanum]|uniref:L-lactate dehydrogenase (Cytochrome) n=1 Tax=Fusarium mexicanum TaxID=751941 RepID=A0A8H5ISD1_9HYPO|nr:L-lactate dehydrogenase (cytochrome) [Fusarium mexicanum]
MAPQYLTQAEVSRHTHATDAWIFINGDVWDVTGFAEMHPGGEDVITEHYGKDASEVYNSVHGPKLAMGYFGTTKLVGRVPELAPALDQQSLENPKLIKSLPPLDSIINLQDFEDAARSCLNERSWVGKRAFGVWKHYYNAYPCLVFAGKREANERYEMKIAKGKGQPKDKRQNKQSRAASAAINPDVTWTQIKTIKGQLGIPIFVKGIQSAEDAMKAFESGCEGIYVSNHGGRGVDTSQPSLLTLAEINIKCPQLLSQMTVLIDGGIRRGTDVFKAICLGAHGVCLGRPFFYALMYGEDGVRHLMNILTSLAR